MINTLVKYTKKEQPLSRNGIEFNRKLTNTKKCIDGNFTRADNGNLTVASLGSIIKTKCSRY